MKIFTKKEKICYESLIKKSRFQRQSFEKQIMDYIENKMPKYESIYVCITPKILMQNGAYNFKLVIHRNVLDKILKPKDSAHKISLETILKIPKEIEKPILVLKGSSPNTLISIIDLKNDKGNDLFVTFSLNAKENQMNVTKISSSYGKPGIISYLINHSNYILDFYNKKKTNLWLDSHQLQLVELNNNTSNDIRDQFPEFLNKDLSYIYIIHKKKKL